MKKKVVVGLSGGVDSAVSAKLLVDAGYDVTGATLKLLSPLPSTSQNDELNLTIEKNQNRDIEDAKKVAKVLGIKHFIYDVSEEFRNTIINYFIEEYKNGRTPNPCFICNREIKMGLFLDRVLKDGFDFIATGHYAQIIKSSEFGNTRFLLKKGIDTDKDQSYFLALLNQYKLSHTLFPLANLKKTDVRLIAEKANLLNAHRPDSQDICFVPGSDYTAVINALAQDSFSTGKFLDIDGNQIGIHRGLQYYTIGQRRGLAISTGYPIYVIKKNAEQNSVTVGKTNALFSTSLIAKDVNLIAFDKIEDEMNITVKTRYRQKEKNAKLIPQENSTEFKIEFEEPEKSVAEGQAVVFYLNDYVLGGGVIKEVERLVD